MTAVADLSDTRRWAVQGTGIFLDALERTPDASLAEPTALPGWTRRHLVAHVAANAEALLNLTRWAATGIETPMYTSPEQRDDDIRSGALRAPRELREWVEESAGRLAAAFADLTDDEWSRPVRTAHGREVPATQIPWLRSREVMVHAADLDPTLTFAGLPEPFLVALADDIVTRRSTADQAALVVTADGGRHVWSVQGAGQPVAVEGKLAAVVAYLAGRPSQGVTSRSGAVPQLLPWL